MRAAVATRPSACGLGATVPFRGVAAIALAAAAMLDGPEIAQATTDTTFGDPLDTVEGIVGSTGGQLAAALAVGAALVGSVLRLNAMQLMGTGIVTSLVGSAIAWWPTPPATSSRAVPAARVAGAKPLRRQEGDGIAEAARGGVHHQADRPLPPVPGRGRKTSRR